MYGICIQTSFTEKLTTFLWTKQQLYTLKLGDFPFKNEFSLRLLSVARVL